MSLLDENDIEQQSMEVFEGILNEHLRLIYNKADDDAVQYFDQLSMNHLKCNYPFYQTLHRKRTEADNLKIEVDKLKIEVDKLRRKYGSDTRNLLTTIGYLVHLVKQHTDADTHQGLENVIMASLGEIDGSRALAFSKTLKSKKNNG